MSFRLSRAAVRKLSVAAGAVFCPHCRQLVCPLPDPDALAAAIIAQSIAAMEQSIEQDTARLRELAIEDSDSLLRNATPEEVEPILPLLDAIRERIARKEPTP